MLVDEVLEFRHRIDLGGSVGLKATLEGDEVEPGRAGGTQRAHVLLRQLDERLLQRAVQRVVGTVLGMDVLKSNNAPFVTGDDYAVIAGHTSAISFAEQIVEMETLRLQTTFGTGVPNTRRV